MRPWNGARPVLWNHKCLGHDIMQTLLLFSKTDHNKGENRNE